MMSSCGDKHTDELVVALKKNTAERDDEDLLEIFQYLRSLADLSVLSDDSLWSYSRSCGYECHSANTPLYMKGDSVMNWFILISGSVYINGSLYSPPACIGYKDLDGVRENDCLVTELSELITLQISKGLTPLPKNNNTLKDHVGKAIKFSADSASDTEIQVSETMNNCTRNKNSVDLRGSGNGRRFSTNGEAGNDLNRPITSLHDSSDTLSHDYESDDEPCTEPLPLKPVISLKERVHSAMEKDPSERTEEDIEVLMKYLQNINAFSNMTSEVRRAMCATMQLAVLDDAGTVVLSDKELLDSWSTIVDGQVEVVRPDGNIEILDVGESFGITRTMEKSYHQGIMRTRVPNCRFVCIMQKDYYDILSKGVENTCEVLEEGAAVLLTEKRTTKTKTGLVVIRGTGDRLMRQLVEERSCVDGTFVEDFLLTYRTFIQSADSITQQLLDWFNDLNLRTRVIHFVLLWVNNHYSDFERSSSMLDFLDKFSSLLRENGHMGECDLLDLTRSTRSKPRSITLIKDDSLWPPFTLLSRSGRRDLSLYVEHVGEESSAERVGLREGDQILEVNGESWNKHSDDIILKLINDSTRLDLSVKCNLTGYHTAVRQVHTASRPHPGEGAEAPGPVGGEERREGALGFIFPSQATKKRIKKLAEPLLGLHTRAKPLYALDGQSSGSSNHLPLSPVRPIRTSTSDPELNYTNQMPSLLTQSKELDNPLEQVLKIYRLDQSFRYISVYKEMTAGEVVSETLKEFNMSDAPSFYNLVEVSIESSGRVRQSLVSDHQTNLAEQWTAYSRFYIKSKSDAGVGRSLDEDDDVLSLSSDTLEEIRRECQSSLLQFSAGLIAEQLTARDAKLFVNIEGADYLSKVFGLAVSANSSLEEFSQLSNQELYWVVTEVCSELNLMNRAKLIQHFIKIARHCKVLCNFNAMFSIVSGLRHSCVSRLKQTWDKVSSKHFKHFKELETYLDPSRNMANYRDLLSHCRSHPSYPVIPFFPIVMKDLTFIHLGNDTTVNGLINFEKLRMMSKEIRSVINMAARPNQTAGSVSSPVSNHSRQTSDSSISLWSSGGFGTTGLGTLKRKKQAFYEEAMLVRRARLYVLGLTVRVLHDESLLVKLSEKCEPPPDKSMRSALSAESLNSSIINSNNNNSVIRNKDLTSVQALPKFGTESPQAVRKLMALSEGSKTRRQPPPLSAPSNHLSDSLLALASTPSRKPVGAPPTPVMKHPNPVSLSSESSSVMGQGQAVPFQGHLNPGQGHLNPGQGHLNPGQGHLNVGQGYLNIGQGHLNIDQGQIQSPRERKCMEVRAGNSKFYDEDLVKISRDAFGGVSMQKLQDMSNYYKNSRGSGERTIRPEHASLRGVRSFDTVQDPYRWSDGGSRLVDMSANYIGHRKASSSSSGSDRGVIEGQRSPRGRRGQEVEEREVGQMSPRGHRGLEVKDRGIGEGQRSPRGHQVTDREVGEGQTSPRGHRGQEFKDRRLVVDVTDGPRLSQPSSPSGEGRGPSGDSRGPVGVPPPRLVQNDALLRLAEPRQAPRPSSAGVRQPKSISGPVRALLPESAILRNYPGMLAGAGTVETDGATQRWSRSSSGSTGSGASVRSLDDNRLSGRLSQYNNSPDVMNRLSSGPSEGHPSSTAPFHTPAPSLPPRHQTSPDYLTATSSLIGRSGFKLTNHMMGISEQIISSPYQQDTDTSDSYDEEEDGDILVSAV